MQGGHQADIGSSVEFLDLVVTVLAIEKHDGLPSVSLKPPVDSVGFGLHLCQQVAITFDVGAAGCANLQKSELAAVSRMLFEQPLDSQEPFQNAFRVVHTVHPNAQEGRLHADLL